jgi:hypothetical protein
LAIGDLLMIIRHFHIVRVPASPSKANAPLIVDANAMLAFAIPLEFFESISGRDAQVPESLCRIEDQQLSQSCPLDAF